MICKRNIWRIPVGLWLAGILVSCVNDLDDIQKVVDDPNAPAEVSQNLELFFTDSGVPQVKLKASLSEKYYQPKEITYLKNGFRVDFYDALGQVASTLTARTGEIKVKEGRMIARDSVELYNYANDERLRTEELIWNQNDSLIYSEKNVSVSTPDGVLYGKGLKTSQDFSSYTFYQPYGEFKVKKQKEDNDSLQ